MKYRCSLQKLTHLRRMKSRTFFFLLFFSLWTLSLFLYIPPFYPSKKQVSFDSGVPLSLWLPMVCCLDIHALMCVYVCVCVCVRACVCVCVCVCDVSDVHILISLGESAPPLSQCASAWTFLKNLNGYTRETTTKDLILNAKCRNKKYYY